MTRDTPPRRSAGSRASLARGLAALACAAMACGPRVAPAKPAGADRTLVLITIDGLSSCYLDDPKAEMPTIRRLAREGASATRMNCILPSVTWPTHTSLATGVFGGRHGVIGNSYWDREAGKSVPFIPDPLFDKDEIVKVPTLYDVAHRAGLKTAAVCWPASRNARTLHWTVPDIFPNDLFQKYSTPQLLDDCRAASIPFERQEDWCKMPGGGVPRDWMYARIASMILREHRPNLLMLHLVECDHVQHAHGPQSPEAYWVCSHSDDRVRDVVETCEREFPGRATILVLSDHGFIPVTRNIQPNVILRQEGLLRVEAGKVTARHATSHSQGGSAFVYVLDRERRAEILGRIAVLFRDVEGIDSVIEQKDYARYGLVTPDRDPRMGDLVLTAKSGFAFSDSFASDKIVTEPSKTVTGTHGHDPALPMMGSTFVAWGVGIRPGARLPEINSVDVAPTVATIMGLEMSDVDGRVLTEILAER